MSVSYSIPWKNSRVIFHDITTVKYFFFYNHILMVIGKRFRVPKAINCDLFMKDYGKKK